MTTVGSRRVEDRPHDAGRLGYAARSTSRLDAPAPEGPPITRRSAAAETGAPRCSFAQEQFWFVDRLTPDNAAFTFSWPLRLRGPLDTGALREAFAEVARRHESLRTRFALEQGRPVQVVDAPRDFELPVVDVSASGDPEAAARRLVEEETRRPFDLERGGLVRASLIRLSETDHVLQTVVHHIVFDEWSKVVLYRELSALYAALVEGRDPNLPEPPVQYADYAEWQRSLLADDELQEQVDHWAAALAGAPAALELPTDRPRPPVASLRGARRRLPFPPELTSALRRLTDEAEATFFAGVLALFNVLLHRHTGADDVLVGIPVDSRSRPEIADTIGVFLNTVVIRSDLSGAPSFRQLLEREQAALQDASEHPDIPFERLVRELRPARDLSRHPIFQVLLAINPPEPSLDLPGIEVEELETETAAAKVDLFLFLQEASGGGYDALWEYSTDLFREETVEQLHSHLVRLLESALAEPDRPIGELELLEAEERRRLLVDWNGPAVDYPARALHELVDEQVRLAPEAIAVAAGDEELTYAELDARAGAVAARLQEAGVRRGSLVALSVERSHDLVVAALAVLKAGGAFVPIDPDLPSERVSFMLEDSAAAVLLTQSHLREALPAFAGHIVDVDGVAPELGEPEPIEVTPDDVAYAIYTSGSTGRPKGVLNTHRGIVNRLLAMQDSYRLGPPDRLLLKTPSSFDVVVRELFWPLVTGARIVVAAPGGHRDPAYIADLIEREQITVVHFVPSMLQAFVDRVPPLSCRSLRCVLSGGEELTPELASRFFSSFACELHNFYGPTEAAVSVTAWRCDPASARNGIPIGRPIANSQVFVLDERLQPVPQGVWGELFIGGAQVALGYHGRPALTAELFVPNPFGEGRLYRTGDLGRWASGGVLEFGGRKDAQVKIRGVRIETGEVEAVLSEHPDVDDSAVVLTASPSGERSSRPTSYSRTLAASTSCGKSSARSCARSSPRRWCPRP
jgi:amino acid adenylation domain-containing protein